MTSLRFFIFEEWCKCTTVPDSDPHPYPYDLYVFGPPGSASGSVSQRYGCEDPDPYGNVTDPQHWSVHSGKPVRPPSVYIHIVHTIDMP